MPKFCINFICSIIKKKKKEVLNTNSVNSYDVFLSYSHNDKLIAHTLFNILIKSYNLKVWIDQIEIINNDDYAEKILKGIKNSKSIICLISKSYVKSNNCCSELKIAKSLNKRIFLVMIENMRIEEYAIGYHAIGIKQCDLSQNINWLSSNLTSSEQFKELIAEIIKTVHPLSNEA
jgi:hypothetical protein